MQAVKKGFDLIFPVTVMGILTSTEIEYRIMGPAEIDIDLLKKITRYQSCTEDNEYVERFWRTLEGFTEDEKSLYLKFVWGRSRLPPENHLKDQWHTVYLLHQGRHTNHDQHFPEAHTCFFQIDVPRYTKDSIARDKILYAIEACGEIDTDAGGHQRIDEDADLFGRW